MDQMSPGYDLIINSNNSLSGITQGKNFLHFIYFPREARVIPGFRNSVYNKISSWFFKILYSHYSVPNEKSSLVAISNFTKEAISRAYNIPHEDIELIYPPIPLGLMDNLNNVKKVNSVISIGRFDSNKDQISQIKIAQKTPDLFFNICGYTPNKQSINYFNSCESLIKYNDISNVKLFKNADQEELERLLNLSKFFMHTMKDEPFGLGTVEAILHGCLPIVHNSGGSSEIVGQKRLLFNNLSEAAYKITELIKLNPNEKIMILNNLKERIKQFDASRFRSVFTAKLEQILN